MKPAAEQKRHTFVASAFTEERKGGRGERGHMIPNLSELVPDRLLSRCCYGDGGRDELRVGTAGEAS